MSLGIALTNGLEAVVITDGRSFDSGRKKDSENKVGRFENSEYHGIVFGAGNGNLVWGIVNNSKVFQQLPSLVEYVATIHAMHQKQIADSRDTLFQKIQQEAGARVQVFPGSPEQKQQMLMQDISRRLEEYDKARREGYTSLVVAAFDKNAKGIRIYYVDENSKDQTFSDHIEIGSGRDGANFYFTTKLEGIDCSNLRVKDLLFCGINAYSMSTVNIGVGGTPKIAIINSNGISILPPEPTRALANVSGAYLAELEGVNKHDTLLHMGEILNEKDPQYDVVAEKLGINNETLRTMVIPYSVWQEKANTRFIG